MTPPPSLDDLIRTVQHDAATAEPLDQLATASATVAELTETTDAVLGHYVDRCRRSGHSWTEISGVLGVSKQAVHKRFSFTVSTTAPTMERFTSRARTVLQQARAEATRLGHAYVGTEHLLLGLFAEPEAVAGKILDAHNITKDLAEGSIMEHISTGHGLSADAPYTPRLKQLLEGAVGEALDLGHNYIGTEHLLLAFYREPESLGTQVLVGLGASADEMRADVIDALAGYQQ
ncbi:MAG TPA: Clp protease N-terminal domain-containing protein [Mycobacteriales bacterium]|jgi:hypothetical protein|nr:Clp protease N-terminal domain-containing protein [Mycobacteriales bacterium]